MKITSNIIVKGFRYWKHYGFREFCIRIREKKQRELVSYDEWREKHTVSENELTKQRIISRSWDWKPMISIVVPLYNTPELFLKQMIESVLKQSYENWQLCLADASDNDRAMSVIQYYSDARIVYVKLKENGGISKNTNEGISLCEGEVISFLDHDDMLAENALYEVALLVRDGYDMIYSDEDKVDESGTAFFEPHFKPEFNEDLLRSNNYVTHFLAVRAELCRMVGKLEPSYEGAQDYDFIFRCSENAEKIGHVPKILYHWRTHANSTAENPFSKICAIESGKRAIEDHLIRMHEKGTVEPTKQVGFYNVSYEVQGNPRISIVIPNKDEVKCLKKCLKSIEESSYENYEVVVVENNSSEETFAYYEKIAPRITITENGVKIYEGNLRGGQKIRVVVWEREFNYSAINNFGVSFAEGEYLILLNNDIEVLTKDWMQKMVANCQRKNVVAVGAKLYYPDNTVQHAGIVVGIGGKVRGIAANMFVGLPRGLGGYLHKANIQMNYSAVTAACLMVSKCAYEEVGGFDEKLKVAFNDVDFCLKLRELGKLIVYCPFVEAYHYESKSRGQEDTPEKLERFQGEIEYMRTKWIDILKQGDPYYNPNFSRVYVNYSLNDD